MESGFSQHLRTQDFVGCIALSVLHGTAVVAGEEEHLPVVQQLLEVMIQVTCLLHILHDEEEGSPTRLPPMGGAKGSEVHGSG